MINLFDQVHFGVLHSDPFLPISTEEALSKGKLYQFAHKIFHFSWDNYQYEIGKANEVTVDKRASYAQADITPVLFGRRLLAYQAQSWYYFRGTQYLIVLHYPIFNFTTHLIMNFLPIEAMRIKVSIHFYQGRGLPSKLITRILLRLFPKLVSIITFDLVKII